MGNTYKAFCSSSFRSAVRGLPDWSIAHFARQDLVAPCYHMVSDDSPVHTKQLYRQRGIEEFKRDLDQLLKFFKPLSLEDLRTYGIRGEPLPEKSLFLSFDDGFREMSEIVADICRKKGIPATFFLTTAFLDNKTLGFRHKASLLIELCKHRHISADEAVLQPLAQAVSSERKSSGDIRGMFLSLGYKQADVLDQCAVLMEVDFTAYLRTVRPYLSGDQVTKLMRDGFSIGGHSVDHPLYADLPLQEQIAQTRDCMDELSSRFQPVIKAFAFPFVSDGVEEPFYKEVFGGKIVDLAFCIGRMPDAPAGRAWQRFGVESEKSIPIQKLLNAHVEGRLRKRLFSHKTKEVSH